MSDYYHCRFLVEGNTKKILQTFDTGFETKMMVKSGAIKILFKSHEPFQSYQLTGPA